MRDAALNAGGWQRSNFHSRPVACRALEKRTLVDFAGRPNASQSSRALKKYPLPVTVSVIEAEIRARAEDQKPEEEAGLVEIARSMFALPNVQAAVRQESG